ncbi:uncharacterized protein LOC128922139 [Zeugodacus cucurbitae]|uniref:uncharacterized protein LOC128922139 n=1 Tax=Zeugodacus cucurbitae TaxID=28588 RepID=UPI0023D92E3B|nr:uncharacterized protein LOC128922139 [Zeugodacus cucurbitae]
MGKDEAKNACIDLVTVEKFPLAVLDSKGFQTLTSQIFRGLDIPAITSRNIMGLVDEKLNCNSSEIKATLENRIISLKMDTATRLNRGILGVNVQYMNCDKICIKTLGLIELKVSHTSQNICSEIKTLLNEFNLHKEQIYTITTDNGKNMVKAVDIMNRCEVSDLNDADNVLEESLYNEEVTTNLRIHSISSIKCAAHTLQLAVKDFMLSLESVEVIEKARKIVKLLRTPSFRYLIAEKSLPQPILDVATRWCSTYQMLKKLQTFRSFCEKHLKPSLKDREESFFANNAVLCSIYLDPRIRRVLLQKPLSIMLARAQLKGLLAQILNLKKSMNPIPRTSPNSPTVSGSLEQGNELLSQNSTTCSLLKEFLNNIEVASDDEAEDDAHIEQLKKGYSEIDNYCPKPVSLNRNIMEYWKEKQFQYPHLYQLANVVHSVPQKMLYGVSCAKIIS